MGDRDKTEVSERLAKRSGCPICNRVNPALVPRIRPAARGFQNRCDSLTQPTAGPQPTVGGPQSSSRVVPSLSSEDREHGA